MRKAIAVSVTTALIIALIGMWMRSAPVATKAATAAGIKPSTGTISSFELTSGNRKAPASAYPESDFRVLVGDQSAGK